MKNGTVEGGTREEGPPHEGTLPSWSPQQGSCCSLSPAILSQEPQAEHHLRTAGPDYTGRGRGERLSIDSCCPLDLVLMLLSRTHMSAQQVPGGISPTGIREGQGRKECLHGARLSNAAGAGVRLRDPR